MRNLLKLAFVSSLLLATAAWSQSSPPASIYSIGGMHMPPPRASIYSAPSFSQACCGPTVRFGGSFGHNPRFNVGIGTPRFGQQSGVAGRHRHFSAGQTVIPVYVPYYGGYSEYPVQVFDPNYEMIGPGTYERPSDTAARRYYGSEEAARTTADAAAAEENGRYGEHYLDSREDLRRPLPPPPAPEMPHSGVTTANGSDDGTPTVLIFRDGHQAEIGNYAIMGKTIFVLSGERTKIPLSEVDIDKTEAANYTRGVDFHVPPAK